MSFLHIVRNTTSTCLLALSLAACGTAEMPEELPSSQVAPPVSLTADAAFMGESFTLRMDGLAPGATAHLVVALREGISCPAQARGACFNLDGRITFLGSVVGDDEGMATLTLTAPDVGITTAYVQAFIPSINDRSNVATVHLVSPDDDGDADGLTNREELALGTDWTVPDTDFDGLLDGEEVSAGTDPLSGDTDADGCMDAEDPNPVDVDDVDFDGVCDLFDVCTGDDATGDTDADGICQSDDVCPDDPLNDSDGNGVCDGSEIISFTHLGEGECRQSNGSYPASFSRGYHDLSPHSDGDNAAQAIARCQETCADHADWCVAAQVVLNPSWNTPDCRLVTDHALFTGAGNTYDNDEWGGRQIIDGEYYTTYCAGGSASCTTTDIGTGISLNARTGYQCYVMD